MTVVLNKFDERIRNLSDIQSFKQYDTKYIGKSGYFTDSFCHFKDLDNECTKDVLSNIYDGGEAGDYIFECGDGTYRYFLPESLVKKSKKYRPFSLNEFLGTFKVGNIITYRLKGSTIVEHKIFAGYENKIDGSLDNEPGACDVILGSLTGLKYLFDNFEWSFNGRWQPFGVLEE